MRYFNDGHTFRQISTAKREIDAYPNKSFTPPDKARTVLRRKIMLLFYYSFTADISGAGNNTAPPGFPRAEKFHAHRLSAPGKHMADADLRPI